jgi:hypothetical protein
LTAKTKYNKPKADGGGKTPEKQRKATEGEKMKKSYRISVFNASTQQRELMYISFTSKKKAQEFADKMNAADKVGTVCAYVIER